LLSLGNKDRVEGEARFRPEAFRVRLDDAAVGPAGETANLPVPQDGDRSLQPGLARLARQQFHKTPVSDLVENPFGQHAGKARVCLQKKPGIVHHHPVQSRSPHLAQLFETNVLNPALHRFHQREGMMDHFDAQGREDGPRFLQLSDIFRDKTKFHRFPSILHPLYLKLKYGPLPEENGSWKTGAHSFFWRDFFWNVWESGCF